MKLKAFLVALIIILGFIGISCGRSGLAPLPIQNNNIQNININSNSNTSNTNSNQNSVNYNNNNSPLLNNNSINKLGGTFIWVDSSNAAWGQDRWNKELNWMNNLGMDTIIITASILKDSSLALYPTSISGITETGIQPIDKILTQADSLGMDVYIGLALTNDWFSQTGETFLTDLANLNKDNFDELYSRYSSHSSFKGIYIPQEIDNMTWISESLRQRLVNFFLKPLTDHINNANSSLIICTAPFFNTVFQQPAEYQTWWNATLAETPNLDLVILQDGIGAEHANYQDVVNYFTALKNACQSNGRVLWSDLEIYQNTSPPLVPAEISRIVEQLSTEASLVENIVCWEFDNYLSPAHSLASLDLYNDYLSYLEEKPFLENISDGKSYIFSPLASGSYPDSGGELTNGNADYTWSEQVGWWNQSAVAIVVDLGAPYSNLTNFRTFFMRSDSSVVSLPNTVQVSTSDDGVSFNIAGSLNYFTDDDGKVNAYQLTLSSPVNGRYVRFDINCSNWLMLSEVSVYRIN